MESGEEVPGKVTVVSPATDPASTTVQVWVQAENPGERLKPGASVHVAIVTETDSERHGGAGRPPFFPAKKAAPRCWWSAPIPPPTEARCELGVREGDKVQILSGVWPGEEVVIVGGMGVDDKAKVKMSTARRGRRGRGRRPAAPDRSDQKKDEAKPKPQ